MSSDAESSGLPRGRAQAGKLALIFDGACPQCRASMKGLMAFAASDRIEAIDLQDPDVERRFPAFKPEDLLREIHAVDDRGRVWRGADAIREALSRQSGLARVISWLWAVPGFERLAGYQYRRIAAARRRDDPGGHPHCPLT
jgi:predicted DCC family thiol-disulfide oxidoreductase YuxK